MCIRRVARYLAALALAGRGAAAEALLLYLDRGASARDAAADAGVTPEALRSMARRLYEMCGGYARAVAALRLLAPCVGVVEPAVERGRHQYALCSVCGETVPVDRAAQHMELRHPDLVEEAAAEVIACAKSRLHRR